MKRLLSEGDTRKFLKIAGLNALADKFLKEAAPPGPEDDAEGLPPADGMDAPGGELPPPAPPEGDLPPVGDDLGGAPEGEVSVSLTPEQVSALVQLLDTLKAEQGGGEGGAMPPASHSEPDGDEMPPAGGDEGGEEEDEEKKELSEALVRRIAQRVVDRLRKTKP